MTQVQYLPVPNWPGYRVGSDGSVWSWWKRGPAKGNRRMRWKDGKIDWMMLRQTPVKKGRKSSPKVYFTVSMSRFGKGKNVLVHHVVLSAFVGPCPSGREGRHIDDDPSNNKAVNLAWGTHSENMRDMVKNGSSAKGESHSQSKLSESDVMEIRRCFAEGVRQADLCRRFGVGSATMNHIVHRKLWRHL